MRAPLIAALVAYMLGGPFFQPMGLYGLDYVFSSFHGGMNALAWGLLRKPLERTEQMARQAQHISLPLPASREGPAVTPPPTDF